MIVKNTRKTKLNIHST